MSAPAPTEATPRCLRAEQVTVRYHATGRISTLALDAVTVHVNNGEILGIVGESGSGKSTLGRALAGFLPLTSGRVSLGEQTLNGSTTRERNAWGSRSVQMVFQNPQSALDPRYPVWRSVAESLQERRGERHGRRAAAERMLSEVGIDRVSAMRRPNELSGGQQQRVTIARALAARPQFLICDEITSGLDVSIRGGVLNALLSAQRRQGFGCVFISHDIRLVSRLANRIAVIYRGNVVEEGPAEEVTLRPRNPYTVQLMESVPMLHNTYDQTPDGRTVITETPQPPQSAAPSEVYR